MLTQYYGTGHYSLDNYISLNEPTRENICQCGIPGDPSGAGVGDPGGATPTDQYVPKHNPAAWFHSLIDQHQDCKNVVPLDGYHATRATPRSPASAQTSSA